MIDRKQHVMKMAHKLFIEKGYQAASIQDILDYSGISKGTFYNYFSSKSELFMALIASIFDRLEAERNELLIGQDPSNLEIFIKQVELHMESNRKNKLNLLIEEVMFSDEADVKQFIKTKNLRSIRWIFRRFVDIFGESKKPYLLDCAIMFKGIMHQNYRYHALAYDSNVVIPRVVRYSVERIAKMVQEVAEAGDQLIPPEMLDRWLPEGKKTERGYPQQLSQTVAALKKKVHAKEASNYHELLDFILEELLYAEKPRKFLVDSAILSLKAGEAAFEAKELRKLEELAAGYFEHAEERRS